MNNSCQLLFVLMFLDVSLQETIHLFSFSFNLFEDFGRNTLCVLFFVLLLFPFSSMTVAVPQKTRKLHTKTQLLAYSRICVLLHSPTTEDTFSGLLRVFHSKLESEFACKDLLSRYRCFDATSTGPCCALLIHGAV